jgi:hypothetical protein
LFPSRRVDPSGTVFSLTNWAAPRGRPFSFPPITALSFNLVEQLPIQGTAPNESLPRTNLHHYDPESIGSEIQFPYRFDLGSVSLHLAEQMLRLLRNKASLARPLPDLPTLWPFPISSQRPSTTSVSLWTIDQ